MENPNVKHIAIDAGNSVAVMLMVTDQDRPSDEAIIFELERSGFGGKPWALVNLEDIPLDRSNRPHWRLRDGKIVVETP